ncbi:MAG: hypothetical protein MI974_33820 [Chitinophagales bacterium]|nr:hypothetical protein [Chitinophagales bacterium]
MIPQRMSYLLSFVALLLLNISFANTLNSPSWETGGKHLLLIGEPTALYEQFGAKHLKISTSWDLTAQSISSINAEVLAANALFIDESQLNQPDDLKKHPYIQAAIEYAKPIIVQNASSEAISSIAGAGFDAPVVIVKPLDRQNTHLTVLHAEKEGDMPTLKQIQEALDMPSSKNALTGDVTLPGYAQKRVRVSIPLSDIQLSPYVKHSGESSLSNQNKQVAQMDIGLQITIYAFEEGKYARITSTGNGFTMGTLIRDDSKFKGIYLDQAQVAIQAINNSNSIIYKTAPQNADPTFTINTTTSFGIASGPKGIPIPTFNHTQTRSVTMKDFKVVNSSNKSLAIWNYAMQLTADGHDYSKPADLIIHDGNWGIRQIPEWALNMPIDFETIVRVPAGNLETIKYSFHRSFRGASVHRYYEFPDETFKAATNNYSRIDNFSLDFSSIQAFDEAQPIGHTPQFNNYGDITTDNISGWYYPSIEVNGWAPNAISYQNAANNKITSTPTNMGDSSWTRMDIDLDGALYAIDKKGVLSQVELDKSNNGLRISSSKKLEGKTKVLDVAAGPDDDVYYSTAKGIMMIDDQGKRDTIAKSSKYNRLAVSSSGAIYAIRAGTGDKTIHEYNPDKKEWSSTGETAIDITTAGQYVIAVQSIGAIIVYDPQTRKWNKVNSMDDEITKYKEEIVGIDAGGSGSDFVYVATKNTVYRIFYRR